ncbi:uncharacterized protein LOC131215597 [Anopheles bellator]|uniref:uncharacterized protein LOC131215597 n=1 Tax=Anopheles bellator TaxID=139047 RepID=UPI00264A03CB|nr:uncharacterized protein LOC131215597 [Anopheles bellator]
MDRRINWSAKEVEEMIESLKEREILCQPEGKKHRGLDAFKVVANDMRKKGLFRSPEQIRAKLRILRKDYFKAVRSGSKIEYRACEFFTSLHDLFTDAQRKMEDRKLQQLRRQQQQQHQQMLLQLHQQQQLQKSEQPQQQPQQKQQLLNNNSSAISNHQKPHQQQAQPQHHRTTATRTKASKSSNVHSVESRDVQQPVTVGVESAVVDAVPVAISSVPAAVGSVPAAVGAVPMAVGSVPAAVGAVPAAVGAVPMAVGSVPPAVGAVPVTNGLGSTFNGSVSAQGAAPTAPPDPLPDKYHLKLNEYLPSLNTSLANLCKNERYADVMLLVCNDEEHMSIPAHRLVLGTFSSYFATIFERTAHMAPQSMMYIVLPPLVTRSAVQSLLHYMYSGEAIVPTDSLGDVMLSGELLRVHGFCKSKPPGMLSQKAPPSLTSVPLMSVTRNMTLNHTVQEEIRPSTIPFGAPVIEQAEPERQQQQLPPLQPPVIKRPPSGTRKGA